VSKPERPPKPIEPLTARQKRDLKTMGTFLLVIVPGRRWRHRHGASLGARGRIPVCPNWGWKK